MRMTRKEFANYVLNEAKRIVSELMIAENDSSSDKLDANGGHIYEGKELDRAKHADLLSLPKDLPGTNCGNCLFFKEGFCTHKEVQLEVNSRQCCKYWDNSGSIRSWKK